MKLNTVKALLGATAIAFCLVPTATQSAHAATLHNGWNYSIDANNDGSGGSSYELRGMAIKATATDIFVALTGGTPLTGVNTRAAADGNIGWGDLFFNFSNQTFQQAAGTSNMFGIRFAGTNDSGVGSTGVYQYATGMSVAAQNDGYNSLQHYYSRGFDRPDNTMGDITTKAEAYSYFGETTPIQAVMNGGTKIGNISSLSAADLSMEGLNFGHFNATGSQTFGFKFSTALLPAQNFVASLFLECGNDGVALKGSTAAVPEPTTMGGLALAGLGLGFFKSRKRRKQEAAND